MNEKQLDLNFNPVSDEEYKKNRIGVSVKELHIRFDEVHMKTIDNFLNYIKEIVKTHSKDLEYDWNRILFNSYEVEGRGEDYTIYDCITIKFFRFETKDEYEYRINNPVLDYDEDEDEDDE